MHGRAAAAPPAEKGAKRMDNRFEPLFTPWKIGNVEIKNRIVMCPMGGTSLFGWMEPNHFDREAAKFFLDRADHVGLIIPGIAPLKDTLGGRWLYQNKKMFRELKAYMEQIHSRGAKLFVQLTAGMGRSWAITDGIVPLHKNPVLRVLAKPIIDTSYQLASPSPLPSRWSDKIQCRAMTVAEIHEIIQAFAKTAALCKEAGVDGVEVHAVHEGYLLDQFTLPYTNHRTDEYGGSFENRYRFAAEAVGAIKAACGKDYPVSLRYSVVSKVKDFCRGALPGEENYGEKGRDMGESERAARFLQGAGYDMLNADNGTYDSWYWSHPPAYMPQNCNLSDVAHIRKFVDIPVVCAGHMEPETAAEAIAAGKIDAMGVARQFLADGDWIEKLIEDRAADIRPCICCHNGCFNFAHYKGHANDQSFSDTRGLSRCALNPETMQSRKYHITPAARPKRIAVIGGGIGGMETAMLCARRGHTVALYERTNTLGGVFIAAAAPSFKEKDRALIAWYRRQIVRCPNLTVHLGSEVKDVSELDADEIIVATGAAANRLHVPGAERAIDAVDYLLGRARVGDTVAIIGGGLTGCEIAYDLFLQGKHPVLIEQGADLMAARGVCLANSSYLRDFFRLHNVPVYLNSKVNALSDGGVTITDGAGIKKKIPADGVISSIGYHSAPLHQKGRRIHVIGDACKPGNLRTVIWQAWDVGMKL